MDKLNLSYHDRLSYPSNLILPGAYDLQLGQYQEKLHKEKERLFRDDRAWVNLMQLDEGKRGNTLR
jgi:hypothetical protein